MLEKVKRVRLTASLMVTLLWSAGVFAEASIEFDAWSRATPPGASAGAVYGRLVNHSDSTLGLESVSFPGAHHVMIHETVEEDGMARMRHAEISLKPGAAVELKPGGLHVMVMGLKTPLVQGCRYGFSMTWSDGSETQFETLTGSFGQSEKPAATAATSDQCP